MYFLFYQLYSKDYELDCQQIGRKFYCLSILFCIAHKLYYCKQCNTKCLLGTGYPHRSCKIILRLASHTQLGLLFGLAKARLKLSQRRSLGLLLPTHHHPPTDHTNFLGTSRQARKLIFGMQPNHNLTRSNMKKLRHNTLWKVPEC